MKAQIENLKQELHEFLELSKTITQGKWKEGYSIVGDGVATTICSAPLPIETLGKNWSNNRAFIARSRNISPPLVECLLGQIEWLEQYAVSVESANQQLQQILNLWEASK